MGTAEARMTVGSVFQRDRGFDLGLERAGFTIRWQIELTPQPARARAAVSMTERFADVTGRRPPLAQVDWLVGGFPCQDVSVAGAGWASAANGLGCSGRSCVWWMNSSRRSAARKCSRASFLSRRTRLLHRPVGIGRARVSTRLSDSRQPVFRSRPTPASGVPCRLCSRQRPRSRRDSR